MYFIIFLITFLIEATVPTFGNQVDEGTDGVLIETTFIRDMRAVDFMLTCPYNAEGYICADDCETLMACTKGKPQPLFKSNCANISSNEPYCIPGRTRCSATGDRKNRQCAAEEIPTSPCTNNGYFPDPSDCRSYHICTRDSRDTYKCPPNHVFDPTNTKCKLRKRSTACPTINCHGSKNQYVPYPGHKSYYAYCENHEITMFKCDDIHNFEFNPKTLDCDYNCKSTGWFPHHKNSHQYYECYKREKCDRHHHHGHHNRFKSRVHTCPQNYVFDAKRRQCVERSGCCPSYPTERLPVVTKPSTLLPRPTKPSTLPPRPTKPGTIPPTPTKPGTIPPTPTEPGTIPPTPTKPGTIPPTPTKPGTLPPRPTKPGTIPPTPTKPGTIPPTPTKPGTIPPTPTKPGIPPTPTKPGTIPPTPTEPGTIPPTPTKPGTIPPTPTEPGSIPPTPTKPGTIPPTPTEPGTIPPTPTKPGTIPPTPTEPGTIPPTPTEPGTIPPTPTKPGTIPPTPTKPGTIPPTPTKPRTRP